MLHRAIFIVAGLALIVGFSPLALANDLPTARQYINWFAKPETKGTAVVAVQSHSQAFLIANIAMHMQTGKRLFCQPEKLALTSDQAVAILKDFVAENPEQADEPMGIVLLIAFKNTFPCSERDN